MLIHQVVEDEFGEPWILASESTSGVVPILQRSNLAGKYRVLQEIPEQNVSITDLRRKDKVRVIVKDVEKLIFIKGTIFKGKITHSGTTQTVVVLRPGKEVLIDAFCVRSIDCMDSS